MSKDSPDSSTKRFDSEESIGMDTICADVEVAGKPHLAAPPKSTTSPLMDVWADVKTAP
jgi:hypothetical protein